MDIQLLQTVRQMRSLVRNIHFWLIVAILIGLGILHYIEELGLVGEAPSLHFGLERHAMDRILFLIPIVYAIFVFGARTGLLVSAISLILMLPRATIWSPNPRDAFFEIASVILIGIVFSFWYRSRLKAEEQRRKSAIELNAMQIKLQSHEARLATLSDISEMLTYSFEMESLLKRALDVVMDVMALEFGLVFAIDEKSQELRLVVYDGISDRFVQEVKTIRIGEGFNGLVAQTGEPLIIEDVSSDPKLTKEIVTREKIQAQLIVPLKAKGQIEGTLCVGNRRPRTFLPYEVQLLSSIGSQIAIVIENGHLYQEQQIWSERYRGIFENASEAIWVEDLERNILAANEATVKLSGYFKEELFEMKSHNLFSNYGTPLTGKEKRGMLNGRHFGESYDRRLRRKDGIEILVSLTSSTIMGDSEPVGYQYIARDVTMERRREENLRFYVQQVTKAQEDERKRIARELHDETAQQLIALSHQIEDFAENNMRLLPADMQLFSNWQSQLKDTVQGVRRFTRDLRPAILDDLGLIPAIEWLIADLKESDDINTNLKIVGDERRFSPEVELLLFRIVQEALSNVRRHSGATSVDVAIYFTDSSTRLVIEDNGKGFQLPKVLGDLSHEGKLGLIGIEERVHLLGGIIKVKSKSDKGTSVNIAIPASASLGSSVGI